MILMQIAAVRKQRDPGVKGQDDIQVSTEDCMKATCSDVEPNIKDKSFRNTRNRPRRKLFKDDNIVAVEHAGDLLGGLTTHLGQ
jgi:hypothetical protein